MQEITQIAGMLLTLAIFIYAGALMVGGPKLGNRFINWLFEKITDMIWWTLSLPFRIAWRGLQKAFGKKKKKKKRNNM